MEGQQKATITIHQQSMGHLQRPPPPNTSPTSITVTATEPPAAAPGATYVQLKPRYFTTLAGILKLVEILFAVICMACASPAWRPGTSWFLFVVVICFILTIFWIFVYLLSLADNIKIGISWLSLELVYTAIATILYFTAFIVQLAIWSPVSSYFTNSNIAAGCFGLFNFVVYAVATYLLYVEKKNEPK